MTHQLQYLRKVKNIIVMEAGKIKTQSSLGNNENFHEELFKESLEKIKEINENENVSENFFRFYL